MSDSSTEQPTTTENYERFVINVQNIDLVPLLTPPALARANARLAVFATETLKRKDMPVVDAVDDLVKNDGTTQRKIRIRVAPPISRIEQLRMASVVVMEILVWYWHIGSRSFTVESEPNPEA